MPRVIGYQGKKVSWTTIPISITNYLYAIWQRSIIQISTATVSQSFVVEVCLEH
jgi:hypothetical protein